MVTVTLELEVLIWPMDPTVLYGKDDSETPHKQPKTSKRKGRGGGERGRGEGGER